jgi:AraC-like DNA-binding protein
VADYHAHPYYEVNLIFSGNVNILLPDQSLATNRQYLILTAPGTPHYIACNRDTLYSRLYLSFSLKLLEDFVPGCQQLLAEVFGSTGRMVPLSRRRTEHCKDIIQRIEKEEDLFRQKLLIVYLLSSIRDFAGRSEVESRSVPVYVIEALSYIERNYSRKIVAAELADSLHIGRTTLMTAFKKYTGSSLNDYLVRYRINIAKNFLRQGVSVQETAERCGFGDSSGLIRNFKKIYGITPGHFFGEET